MIEPLGYFDIILQSLEILSLIGLLVLFFLERAGYGRESIGRDSWPTILLYNILTLGAYGIYWRLKVSYALHSRDRLSSWQWVLALLAVFVVYVIDLKLLVMLTIWDFALGTRLTKTTGQPFSWFWTLVCGHLYLASYVEREADLLPLDFRAERPERRPRFVLIYCIFVVLLGGVIALCYSSLVKHRAEEFARIPAESVDRSGHWHEVHEKYERIYSEDKEGHRDTYVMIRNPDFKNIGEWARYPLETKIHQGTLYTYNWFSCVEQYEVVERRADLLVTRNHNSQSLVENRIPTEDFALKREDFLRTDSMARGWELGQLLRSPWGCELGFIRETWDESTYFLFDTFWHYIFKD